MKQDPVADFISARTRTQPHTPVNFWILIILALGLLAFAVAKLGTGNAPELPASIGENGTEEPDSRIYTVTYKVGVFSPTNLRIRVGDTVTFKNTDNADIRITSQLNPLTQKAEFDSVGPVPSGSAFSFTFTREGVFAYHVADDQRQAGVIIVRAP